MREIRHQGKSRNPAVPLWSLHYQHLPSSDRCTGVSGTHLLVWTILSWGKTPGFLPAQKTPLHAQLHPHELVCFFHPESPSCAGEGCHCLQLLLQEAQQWQRVGVLRVGGMPFPTIASHLVDQSWERGEWMWSLEEEEEDRGVSKDFWRNIIWLKHKPLKPNQKTSQASQEWGK